MKTWRIMTVASGAVFAGVAAMLTLAACSESSYKGVAIDEEGVAEAAVIDSLQAYLEQWRIGTLPNPGFPSDPRSATRVTIPTSRRIDSELDRERILRHAADAGLSESAAEVLLDRVRAGNETAK